MLTLSAGWFAVSTARPFSVAATAFITLRSSLTYFGVLFLTYSITPSVSIPYRSSPQQP